MKYWFFSILVAVVSYLFGNLKTTVLASNFVFRTNLNRLGSGNRWLSNFRRVYGVKGFIKLLVVELIRDVLPLLFAGWLFGTSDHAVTGKALAMFCLTLGQMYPFVYEFKGSYGVICMGISALFVSISVGAAVLVMAAVTLFFVRRTAVCAAVASLTLVITGILVVDDPTAMRVCLFLGLLAFFHTVPGIARSLSGKEEKLDFQEDISYKFDQKF